MHRATDSPTAGPTSATAGTDKVSELRPTWPKLETVRRQICSTPPSLNTGRLFRGVQPALSLLAELLTTRWPTQIPKNIFVTELSHMTPTHFRIATFIRLLAVLFGFFDRSRPRILMRVFANAHFPACSRSANPINEHTAELERVHRSRGRGAVEALVLLAHSDLLVMLGDLVGRAPPAFR